MANILDGKKLARELESIIKQDINNFNLHAGRSPGLAVIRVGDDPASVVYVSNKEKACNRIGINSSVIHFKSDTTETEIIKKIENLNNDENVDGILLQLPLPKTLDEQLILQAMHL